MKNPVQNRNRIVGGRYKPPFTYTPHKRFVQGLCPCITATEYKGCATDRMRASRFYGRKLTVNECAHHMGLKIPEQWLAVPSWFMSAKINREIQWQRNLYEAIGNGVPVYMARKFGEAYAT